LVHHLIVSHESNFVEKDVRVDVRNYQETCVKEPELLQILELKLVRKEDNRCLDAAMFQGA
jgi:hypothetical protein